MADPDYSSLWRQSTSPDEFCAKAGLREYAKTRFLSAVKTMDEENVTDFAWSFAADKLGQEIIKLAPHLKDCDATVKAFVFLGRNYDAEMLSGKQRVEARLAIEALLTSREETSTVPNVTTASEAFSGIEKQTPQGRFASEGVFTTLMQQHALYNDDYISPYTTIVGPSGIGKSFAVKQLAVRYGMYVVYNNLGPTNSRGFPRPVTMGAAPIWGGGGGGGAVVQLWLVYLERQLLIADCCKEVGITAPGLFHFLASDNESVLAARAAFGTLITTEPGREDVCQALAAVRDVLENLKLNNAPDIQQKNDELPVVVCFDEARALLDGVDDWAFRSLRQAAQRLAQNLRHSRRSREDPHAEIPDARNLPFFLVLLDTTVEISNFTPPLHHDRTAKVANQRILYPIFQIDSLDIFAPKSLPDPLFSFGRPLWGALLDAGHTWDSLLRLAVDKMTGYEHRTVSDIAVLSYRMNFYISSTTMAKDLVASLMRCLVAISPDRNDLVTIQPSEPILAFAASKLLQDPSARLSCVRSWIGGLHLGSINPGDIGEQVAFLVLLFAFDSVAFGTPAGLNTAPHAVPLGDFIAALLGEQVRTDLCHSYAGTITGSLLQEGAVFFNHFVRASTKPTLAVLENAYRRGAALFLPALFPGMDVALPVRASPGGPLALLLLQVKNRKGDTNTPGLRLSMAEDLRKAINHLGLSTGLHSVIGLAMCLRTQGDAHFVSMAPDSTKETAETAASRRPTRSSAKGKEKVVTSGGIRSALLGIAFGLDQSVYACLRAPSRKRKRGGLQATWGHGQGLDTGQAEMGEVSRLFGRLVGSWPNAYADADTESTYAQRLLGPFFDMTVAAEEDEEDNRSA